MKKLLKLFGVVSASGLLLLPLAGCEQESETGEAIEETTEEIGEGVEETGEGLEEGAEEVTEGTEDLVDDDEY
jgi:hypothetical protein